MLHRRIYQFLMIYFIGLAALMLVKYSLNLSDYTIPGVNEIWNTYRRYFGLYLMAVLNTLAVAILGHVLSICMATVVGIIGRLTLWIGSFIRVAAYNIQAYPIVAVAPIIFILLGDGLSSRLLIAAMICYFPLLLSFIGILSEPVAEIEHFFESTLRMNWRLQVKIRAFENIHKLVTVIVGSATGYGHRGKRNPGHGRYDCCRVYCGQRRDRIQYPHRPVSERSIKNSGGSFFNRGMHLIISGFSRVAWIVY
jgi:NitT/TauT family transport system permease protein